MRLIRLLKSDLAKESVEWVEKDIVSPEQAAQICDLYGIDYYNQSKHSYGYYVLVTLGYLFIGLATITLISENWDEIPRAIRMLGLVSVTLVTNLLAARQYYKGKDNAAIGTFFLGSLFYGASIMLIAQIYHIGEHYPDGIFWWMLGVLPLAILLESVLLMLLATCLAYIWFFVESSLNFFPMFFVVFLAVLGWFVISRRRSLLLFISFVIGIGVFAEYSLSWLMEDHNRFNVTIENMALGAGIFVLFHGVSKWLCNCKESTLIDYGTVLGVWALRFALVTMFILSFSEPWEELIEEHWQLPWFTIIICGVFSVAMLLLTYFSEKKIIFSSLLAIVFNVALWGVIYTNDESTDVIFQVIDNIALVVVGVWLIVNGIKQGISYFFYLGIVTIFLIGLLRYVDLVNDYIGATILFMVFAAILLAAAKFMKVSNEKEGGHHE